MNMCDCVKSKPAKEQPEIIYQDRIVEKEVIKEVPRDKTFIESYGLPISITLGGLGTCILCNWKQIVKFSKSFA